MVVVIVLVPVVQLVLLVALVFKVLLIGVQVAYSLWEINMCSRWVILLAQLVMLVSLVLKVMVGVFFLPNGTFSVCIFEVFYFVAWDISYLLFHENLCCS